jgi:hypothetical protein
MSKASVRDADTRRIPLTLMEKVSVHALGRVQVGHRRWQRAMSRYFDKEISLSTKRSRGKCISESIATHDSVLLSHHSAHHSPFRSPTTSTASKKKKKKKPPNMQFILSNNALAATATALPAASQATDATDFTNYDGERVLISLPSGCTKKDLASKSLLNVGCCIAEADHGQNVLCTLSAPLVLAAPLSSRLAPTRLRIFRALALLLALLPTSMSARTAFPSKWKGLEEVTRVQCCWA